MNADSSNYIQQQLDSNSCMLNVLKTASDIHIILINSYLVFCECRLGAGELVERFAALFATWHISRHTLFTC